jgi:hypothetical protein
MQSKKVIPPFARDVERVGKGVHTFTVEKYGQVQKFMVKYDNGKWHIYFVNPFGVLEEINE